MHRTNPITSAFTAYTGGGCRALVDTADDGKYMQEMKGSFMYGEARQEIESPQNYGFTSVVLPATKDKDGQIESCAEAYINFLGSNRSFPVAAVMDDRRYRPTGLKPGENAQYDDNGQMTLMRRNGLYLISLDGKDEKGNNVERFASLRHVVKKRIERKFKKTGGIEDGGDSGGGATPTATTHEATTHEATGGQQQQEQKHEGESINTEIRCTKSRIEFRAGDTVVGYYDVGSETWHLKGKIVAMEGSQGVEAIGKTYLGIDNKGDRPTPKVVTEVGPAEKTWAKPG